MHRLSSSARPGEGLARLRSVNALTSFSLGTTRPSWLRICGTSFRTIAARFILLRSRTQPMPCVSAPSARFSTTGTGAGRCERSRAMAWATLTTRRCRLSCWLSTRRSESTGRRKSRCPQVRRSGWRTCARSYPSWTSMLRVGRMACRMRSSVASHASSMTRMPS